MKIALVLTIALIGLPFTAKTQPLQLSDVQMGGVAGGNLVPHGPTDAELLGQLLLMQYGRSGNGVQAQICYPTCQIGTISFSFPQIAAITFPFQR